MALQVIADDLVCSEPTEIDSGLRGQRAWVGGVKIAAGWQHVPPAARGRPCRSGPDAAAIERCEQRVALRHSTQIPCRINGLSLYIRAPIHMQAVLDGKVLEIAQPSVDLAQGLVRRGICVEPGVVR